MNADDDRWLDEALAAPAERIDHDNFAERVLAALPPRRQRSWAMDYIVSAKANAEVAEYFGEAPAQTQACQQTSDKTFCDSYHALDAAYAAKIHYWTTPQTQCVNGKGDDCTDYSQWTQAWTNIKG